MALWAQSILFFGTTQLSKFNFRLSNHIDNKKSVASDPIQMKDETNLFGDFESFLVIVLRRQQEDHQLESWKVIWHQLKQRNQNLVSQIIIPCVAFGSRVSSQYFLVSELVSS